MMMEQSLFLARIENPIQLQSCLGKKNVFKKREKAQKGTLGSNMLFSDYFSFEMIFLRINRKSPNKHFEAWSFGLIFPSPQTSRKEPQNNSKQAL